MVGDLAHTTVDCMPTRLAIRNYIMATKKKATKKAAPKKAVKKAAPKKAKKAAKKGKK